MSKKTTTVRKSLRNVLKLGVSGAFLTGIAASIVLFSPQQDQKNDQEVSLVVKESNADLAWFSPMNPGKTQRFAMALDELGHEPPRLYDLNNNEVYFSTRPVRGKNPREIMAEYQRKFVEVGINSKMHETPMSEYLGSDSPDAKKRIEEISQAAMDGEITPAQLSDTYLAMTGALIREQQKFDPQTMLMQQATKMATYVDNIEQGYKACNGDNEILRKAKIKVANELQPSNIEKAVGQQNGSDSKCSDDGGGGACSVEHNEFARVRRELESLKLAISEQPELLECQHLDMATYKNLESFKIDFEDRIHGMRSIEAFYDKQSNEAIVTAVWSNDDFDIRKANPEEHGFDEDGLVRGEFPLCDDCKRTWNFGGNDKEEPYTTNVVISNQSVERSVGTYRRLLHEEGWTEAGAETVHPVIGNLVGAPENKNGYSLRFEKDKRYMTVRFRKDHEGRTEVMAMTSN